MTRPAQLEVFEFGSIQTPTNTEGPSPDWLEGHSVGFQEAEALSQSRTDQLGEELVQALGDMQFGFAEARLELLRSLEPFFLALGERFLPAFAMATIGPIVQERLLALAHAGFESPAIIAVAPDHIIGLTDTLDQNPQLAFSARSDPNLKAGQVRIAMPGHEEMIDLDGVLQAACEALAALSIETQERSDYG